MSILHVMHRSQLPSQGNSHSISHPYWKEEGDRALIAELHIDRSHGGDWVGPPCHSEISWEQVQLHFNSQQAEVFP